MDGNGNRAPGNTTVTMPEEYFIRSLSGIDIKKIPAPIEHNIYQLYELFDFYEFTLTAPSFYRNQVRGKQFINIFNFDVNLDFDLILIFMLILNLNQTLIIKMLS